MSTHAMIGKKYGNTIKAIYCHFDGYILGGVGTTLKKNYTDQNTIDELINLGSISSLGTHIGQKVDFDEYNSITEIFKRHENKEEDQCVAYHRDRGEPLEILTYTSLEEYGNNEEFVYLWDNKWLVFNQNSRQFEEF